MSAMIAVTTPDTVFVMGDAAVYDHEGTLTDIRPKTIVFEDLHFAASCRGNLSPLDLLPLAIGDDHASFDDVRRDAPAIFAAIDALMETVLPGAKYEMMLAGWSHERNRGEVVFHATHGNIPESFNQSGPTLLTNTLFVRGQELDCLLHIGLPENEWTGFDPVAHGIPAFERARAFSVDLTCGREDMPLEGYSVGGFVQCVTITADSVRNEVIHEWPDEIGRKIEPASPMAAVAA